MERRDALRLLATSVAGSALLRWEPEALIAAIRPHLDHTPRAGAASDYRFQVLDAHQQKTVAELCDMIIPATGTPGAKAVKVDEFIDVILAEWCSDADRAAFLKGVSDLDAASMQANGVAFVEATAEQRAALLAMLDSELTAARAARKAWKRGAGPPPPDHRKMFWHQMRSLTVTGYYTSEIGYTVERQEVLIPGIYKACMPVEHR
jgi:hypothetical protein